MAGKTDITEDAILLLRAIQDTKGRFGLNLPMEVLRGSCNARVTKSGFDKLPSHGTGIHRSEEHWKAVGRSLIQELLVDPRSAKGFGKGGKGGKGRGAASMCVYGVSAIGQRLLEGEPRRVMADLDADTADAEAERLRRASRRVSRAPPKAPAAKQAAPPAAGAGAAEAEQRPPPGHADTTPAKSRRKSASPQQAAPGVDASKRRKSGPGGAGGGKAALAVGASVGDDDDDNGLAPLANPGPIESPSPLPPALDAALMPFQRAGVAFAVRRGGRALIGDDMGLGKTIQAIASCCAFRDDWPVLIVVPNSVRLVWADELERWIPDMGPGGVNVLCSGQDLHGLKQNTASFHVMTYGILARASPVRTYVREHMAFKMVVVDESHMIKNRTALRTRELMLIMQGASRVLLLSGTPALARPMELYTQIEAVSPGLFASYSAFTSRYCAPKVTPWGMDFTGSSNLQELHRKLRPIMVRRLKADVLSELPSKRRQRVQLEVSESALEACVGLKEQMHNCGEEDVSERRRLMMAMYRESANAKQEAVCEYVEDLLSGGCKFLVFAHHLCMLDALEKVAVRCQVGFMRIDGSVNSVERQRRCALFQGDETVRVALLGIQAAGVGITLTAASTVVFAELHWTPGLLVQAEDRAHRIGQKSSVNVHYLIANGTVDDIIWPSVRHKVEVVTQMCDGRRSHLDAKFATSAGTAAGEVADPAAATAWAAATSAAAAAAAMGAAGNQEEDGVIDVDDLLALTEASVSRYAKAPPKKALAGSEYSVLSMLQGRGPLKGAAKAAASRWICSACGFRNAPPGEAVVVACSGCQAARESAPSQKLPKRTPTTGQGQAAVRASVAEAADDDAVESASEGEADEAAAAAQSVPLAFCVPRATGRVHVLSVDGRALGVNFKLGDWEALCEQGKFPEGCCLREAPAQRTVEAFLQEWGQLRATDHRNLSDQILQLPLRRHIQQRLVDKRSTRRLAAKPQPGAATAQDVVPGPGMAGCTGEDGALAAACAWCGELGATDAGSAYCSRGCEEKDRVRTDASFARKLVFSAEKGVCRTCGLDAHSLFERVKAMTPPERHQELLRAGFSLTPVLLQRPHESLFWQADHIVPVAEGGGEAEITNLRTLCTICHAKETRRLKGRLKCARWAGNSSDIRQCVKRPRRGDASSSSTLVMAEGGGSLDVDVDTGVAEAQVIIIDIE